MILIVKVNYMNSFFLLILIYNVKCILFPVIYEPYNSEGELYTLGKLRDLHKAFVASGSNKK